MAIILMMMSDGFEYIMARKFLILWISVVIYISYDTFIYYRNGRKFFHLRQILGFGLCISRATATIINLCAALILLPQCKKLNQIMYRILSKLWPGLFFFWLEKAKSIHMTVATTLVIFSVLHSISHFVNLWNFSRGFVEELRDINFANYKNENPIHMLLSVTCITGLLMLCTTMLMGVTSLRVVRRKVYNAFWYAHQLYLPFMVLFLIHPLSGVLKQEMISNDNDISLIPSHNTSWVVESASTNTPRFIAIESKTWLWMSIPLTCFFVDLLWRIFSRNRAVVDILEGRPMAGRTLSLKLSCPNVHTMYRPGQYVVLQCPQVSLLEWHPFTVVKTWLWMSIPLTCFFVDLLWRIFSRNRAVVDILEGRPMAGRTLSLKLSCPNVHTMYRPGQYVVLQCPQVSLLEWHPFTVVKVPSPHQRNFVVWIRVKGDWTEALEKLLKERGPRGMNILVDGPFSSPMESVSRNEIAICVAAGVGITPFVAVLHEMLQNPRSHLPGRVHLVWIVRHEQELTWLAELADKTIRQLRSANRPDRLHLQLFVTQHSNKRETHIVINKKGQSHILSADDEKATLLTPNLKRSECINEGYEVANDYPLLGCRVRRGRPHWDRVFGYWVHLYPGDNLNLFCCGPKKLVKLLRNKCKETSRHTKTTINFIHEGFS